MKWRILNFGAGILFAGSSFGLKHRSCGSAALTALMQKRRAEMRYAMTNLNCGAVSCSYNKDKCCCKGDIQVGGKHASDCENTCCESFHKRSGDVYTSAISHPSPTISIDCEVAKCIYNADYRCSAEHVDIKGSNADTSRDTICATFREKI